MAFPILLFIGFLVAVVILAILGNQWTLQRRQAMEQVARRWGLVFHPDHPTGDQPRGSFLERLFAGRDIPGPYEQFSQFKRGSNRKAYNTLGGRFQLPDPQRLGQEPEDDHAPLQLCPGRPAIRRPQDDRSPRKLSGSRR